jgi:DNA-binding XRE family transcriptional regulator
MEVQDRIDALIKALGKNQRTFALTIGVAPTVINHIIAGNKANEGKRNAPSYGLLVKICETYPNVNLDWLVLGKGVMFKDIPLPDDLDIVKPSDATLKALLAQIEDYRMRELQGKL